MGVYAHGSRASWSRWLLFACVLLACAGGAGCGRSRKGGGQGAPPPPAMPLPAFATVDLVGVTIAPAKFDRTAWDGPGGGLRNEDAEKLAGALAIAAPELAFAAALSVLAEPTVRALEKPDVAGWAAFVSGQGLGPAQAFPKTQDSFTPAISARFTRVPLDGSARIRVELTDMDLSEHDAVGRFEIATHDIVAALRAGRVHQVRVAEQTNRQVLFVAISAFPG
jgi:hypothetical protein